MKTYSLKTGILGVFVFMVTVFIIIPFACVKLNELLQLPSSIISMDILLGTVFLVIGGAVALWCVILFFIIGKGTPAPFHPPKKFIVRGPYKYIRNPMMLGVWLMLIGEALILHSLILLFFTICLVIPVGVIFVIRYEEHDLEKRFGNEYLEYKKKTWRWLPRPQDLKNIR